ncbi:MAG: hypothetical protein LUH04_08125 [Clostridium sp.]|nr:hypothetical protein [Clostridium sp.]
MELFAEILVPKEVDNENAGRKGVVFGFSEHFDSEEVAAYAVMFDGENILTMVPEDQQEYNLKNQIFMMSK